MSKQKTIAILTSGGDAPGMNAAVRAVVRAGINKGLKIYGVLDGYNGLRNDTMVEMGLRSVSDIIQRGGTILGTARCLEFKTEEGRKPAYETLRRRGIDGLVVIGGDGSFMGAKLLSEAGFNTIGLPGTIDNDLQYTDYTIGFDTALNTIGDAINKVRDTMTSHRRISIIEVMGRHCGDLALHAGICNGAEVVLVPEVKWTVDEVVDKLQKGYDAGKRTGIIVMAEGTGHAPELEAELRARTSFDVRAVVLGHIQRGGSPTASDRMLASRLGAHAIDLLCNNIGNRAVGIRENKIVDMDIMEALSCKRSFDTKLYELVGSLGS